MPLSPRGAWLVLSLPAWSPALEERICGAMYLCIVRACGSGPACWIYMCSTLPSKHGVAPPSCALQAGVSDRLWENACKLALRLDGELDRGAIIRVWADIRYGIGPALGVWPLDVKGCGCPEWPALKPKQNLMLAIPGGSLAPLREDQAFAELDKIGLGSSSWGRAWAEKGGGEGLQSKERKP